ncbi:hypothetical protein [Nocardiopsis coralliicola]
MPAPAPQTGRSGRWARGTGRAAAAAVLLLSAGACGADEEPEAPAAEVDNSYAGVLPASDTSYSPTEFHGITINVPKDWAASTGGNRLCLTPADGDDCGFGSVQVFADAAKHHDASWPKKGGAFDRENGWTHGKGECRAPGAEGKAAKKAAFTVGKGGLSEHADGLKSHHRVWNVACDGDASFEVRMWYLPESDVLIYVPAADPAFGEVYDEVAASMDITEYKKGRD